MPKKCESCQHFFQPFVEKSSDDAVCGSPAVQAIDDPRAEKMFAPMIDAAREICDREGDGVFVYFEPKQPEAGVAVGPQAASLPEVGPEIFEASFDEHFREAAAAGGAA